MPLNFIEASFIGTVLEGIFYGNLNYIYRFLMLQFISSLGLYCIIFLLYFRVHALKKCDGRNILVYPITSLFLLCSTFFALDYTQEYLTVVSKTSPIGLWRWIDALNHQAKGQGDSLLVWHLNLGTGAIYSFVDVIVQGVLVRRKLKEPWVFISLSHNRYTDVGWCGAKKWPS